MNKNEQAVITAIVETFCIAEDEIKRESKIRVDLGADSLDLAELAMEIEMCLEITIDDEFLTSDSLTVQELMDIVNEINPL